MPSREELTGIFAKVDSGEALSYVDGVKLTAYVREQHEVLQAAQPYANQNPLLAERVGDVLEKFPHTEGGEG